MNLEQQVCSLELAKKLNELGVKQESLFYWMQMKDKPFIEFCPGGAWSKHQVSAFTVAELGEMLPKSLHVGIYMHDLTIIRSSVWRFYYGVDDPYSVYLTAGNDDTEADARAKMLIYLIENKLVTT